MGSTTNLLALTMSRFAAKTLHRDTTCRGVLVCVRNIDASMYNPCLKPVHRLWQNNWGGCVERNLNVILSVFDSLMFLFWVGLVEFWADFLLSGAWVCGRYLLCNNKSTDLRENTFFGSAFLTGQCSLCRFLQISLTSKRERINRERKKEMLGLIT